MHLPKLFNEGEPSKGEKICMHSREDEHAQLSLLGFQL